jgi:hypothetical protein
MLGRATKEGLMDSPTRQASFCGSADVCVLLTGAAGSGGSQGGSEIDIDGMIACTTNNRFNVAGMRSAMSAIFS